jgi:hypothetical protein
VSARAALKDVVERIAYNELFLRSTNCKQLFHITDVGNEM